MTYEETRSVVDKWLRKFGLARYVGKMPPEVIKAVEAAAKELAEK